MFYVTYGKPKSISNKLMDKMVLFAGEFLEINPTIEIDFEDGDFNDNVAGYADYEDKQITVYINPELPKEDLITTFFHEMVHVKQYVKGELVSGEGWTPSRWKGAYIKANYFDSPWEQEAYEYEKVMMDVFKQTY